MNRREGEREKENEDGGRKEIISSMYCRFEIYRDKETILIRRKGK